MARKPFRQSARSRQVRYRRVSFGKRLQRSSIRQPHEFFLCSDIAQRPLILRHLFGSHSAGSRSDRSSPQRLGDVRTAVCAKARFKAFLEVALDERGSTTDQQARAKCRVAEPDGLSQSTESGDARHDSADDGRQELLEERGFVESGLRIDRQGSTVGQRQSLKPPDFLGGHMHKHGVATATLGLQKRSQAAPGKVDLRNLLPRHGVDLGIVAADDLGGLVVVIQPAARVVPQLSHRKGRVLPRDAHRLWIVQIHTAPHGESSLDSITIGSPSRSTQPLG